MRNFFICSATRLHTCIQVCSRPSQKKETKYQLNMFISCCKIESCKIVPCTSEDEREKFVVCTRIICKFSLYQFHLICCLPTGITN